MAGNKSKKKYLSHFLRFAIAAGALYLVFRGEDLGKVKELILGLNLWVLAAAVAIYIVSQVVFVARWYLLLSVQSIKIGFLAAIRLHFLGLFYNNFLPGAVGGDLLRAWYVTKHTDKKVPAALSVFVDRAVGLFGILLMAFGMYWFLPKNLRAKGLGIDMSSTGFSDLLVKYRWPLLLFVVVVFIFIAAALILPQGKRFNKKLLLFIREHGASVLYKVRTSIVIYWNKKLAILVALILTFICQSFFIIGLWLMGREIGVEAGTKYYFIFFPISWLLGTIPISVGGTGIMELWLKKAFVDTCGVGGAQALLLALSQRIILLIGSLPGVIVHLLGAHLPKDFSVDYKEDVN
jgi:hypothetical protein